MATNKKIAIYPGTFDPITLGHLDILKRACSLFDKVIVAIAPSESKRPMFTLEKRIELAKENLTNMPQVEVLPLYGLTVEFAREHNAKAIIRGLRVVSDFEYEFQLAQMNRHLAEEIETVLLMPSRKYFFTSSSIIKQVAHFDVSKLSSFVPPNVITALKGEALDE